ncbi:MAG: class I SAM-dependent methyltransferase [Bacteroidetes bacterium]|nr:MAG: class I SAM-dependent methyltransferase [Bacteroidota bacterium]
MLTLMKNSIDIFQCPNCNSDLEVADDYVLCVNGHKFDIVDDIPMMFVEGGVENADKITYKVKQFYEDNPFPNYDDTDTPALLMSKAETSIFARLLNDELPFNVRILEVGCGTGQLSNYLSFANRQVFGVDFSKNSLLLANNFKKKNSLKRVSFYQMNLFKPVFRANSFDVVICNGVLHHTFEAFTGMQTITKLLKKRGYLIIGLYNRFGRLFSKFRKKIFKLTGKKFHAMDSYLTRTDISDEKKMSWCLDQYNHPHETTHTFGEVLRWFDKTGIEFLSSIPEIGNILALNEDYLLFEKRTQGSRFSRFMTQLVMPVMTNREGGFFIMIGRKVN